MERVKSTDPIREAIKSSSQKFSKRVELLPTGNTMWNLIASGRVDGGNPRARIINVVGDGSSGKTLVALEALAAAYYQFQREGINSDIYNKTKNLKLIYDNAEGVMDFNIEDMYDEEFYKAIDWRASDTVEQFGADFFTELDKMKSGDTVIYVIDSWDALDSKDDKDKFEEDIQKIVKGKNVEKGSYDLGKQKYASKRFFKKICADVHNKKADLTLIIISQVRQKIGITFGEKRYRAGGDALNFYTHLVVWLAEIEKMKVQRYSQERVYGIRVKARVKRSKVWKPFRETEFKILFEYGIDDIGSMMDWYFGPKKAELEWRGEKHSRSDLYESLRVSPTLQIMLKEDIQELWDKVENAVTPVHRKYEIIE